MFIFLTQRVADLMSCRLSQTDTPRSPDCPSLLRVKVNISSEQWEEGVSQSSPSPIEWVVIPVLSLPELYLDVSLASLHPLELQVGHVGPDSQRLLHGLVNLWL